MHRDTQKSNPKIVVIGGGTGSFVLLSGLKRYTSRITALVNMTDDGGSTGQLCDELGVLPPGDVRQCLVALSDSPLVRDLFNYRFEEGSLQGHAFGNLFLTALEKMTGSFGQAVEEASRVLAITGSVLPITLDKVSLVLETGEGRVIRGQFLGKQSNFGEYVRPSVRLEPDGQCNPAAISAIENADVIVIAPGDLYTSIAPTLVVGGVGDALMRSRAKIIYVCNLVTKPGHTDNFSVVDFADEIERFMGGARLDFVLYNSSGPTQELLDKYSHDGEFPVTFDPAWSEEGTYRLIGRDLIATDEPVLPSSADQIRGYRTLIRHDSDRIARAILELI